uniref:Peptidase M24 domain-containing protein n=1 Tax=Aotus nancymaae TaxID=37293 RepID=A0A2K5CD91_AOTNA
ILGKDKQQEQTIVENLVMTKGGIANWVLWSLLEAFISGVWVLSLCEEGDAIIMAETEKIFKKEKEMKKDIAFPTSISVIVCQFSPLKSDKDYILKEGDLGVHVDGFIANVVHTFVVDVAQGIQITGWKADVIKAAHLCAEAALSLAKPGNQNTQVTEAWDKVAHSFNCMPIEGMLPTDQQKKDHKKAEFYVFLSTGEGKAKDAGQRTTIYKGDPVERHFDAVPFTLRAWMGVVECTKHGLLQPFDVLCEKRGEFVAQFKFTVLLMPNGSMLITSDPFEPDLCKSEIEVQDAELKALLQSSSTSKTAETTTSGETLEEKKTSLSTNSAGET